MKRRDLLGVASGSLLVALAGCVGDGDETDDGDDETDTPADDQPGDDTPAEETEEFTVALHGVTAEDLPLDGVTESAIYETARDDHGLSPGLVRVRRDADAIELTTDELSPDEFAAALAEAGLEGADEHVRPGLTAQTVAETKHAIETRLTDAGYDPAVTASETLSEPEVRLLFDDAITQGEIGTVLEARRDVRIVAGYPEDGDSGLQTQTVLEGDDFAQIHPAEPSTGGQAAHVPVRLTADAAEDFVETVRTTGFTGEGVGQCFFDEDEHDSYRDGEYCLYTVVEGEIVFGAVMSAALAETLEHDAEAFIEDPGFQLNTSDLEAAEELEEHLRTARIPTEIEIRES